MKIELEDHDIEAIDKRLAELVDLRGGSSVSSVEDSIFNVKGLAKYLQVENSWIYTQVKTKATVKDNMRNISKNNIIVLFQGKLCSF